MRFLLCLPVLLASTVSGWAADAPKVTYVDHVLPILRDKCLGCHNPDKLSGGLNLSNYTELRAGGSSGEVVAPGDPEKSSLLLTIAHQKQPYMPPKSPPIAKESIEIVRKWIEQGVPENSGSKAAPAKPKVEIALKSITKGKPEGPPPMPPAFPALGLDPVVKTARANAVTALASSPWAPVLAIGGQRQVSLYHADSLELLGVLPFPEGVPHVLKFSRNGALLLAGGGHAGKSGRVVVWSVSTGQRVVEVGEEFDAVLAADISADQSTIALGGPGKMIRLYGTKDGKLITAVKKHTDWVTSLEFSPDGVLLATGDRNGGVFVWEAYTGREYFSLRGHTGAISDLSWRPDSNVLLSASEDGTIRLWEMENGNQIKSWGGHGGGTLSARYGADGRIVSSGRDHLTRVWDGNGGQQRQFEPFPDLALRSSFTYDGSRVVAGDWTGQIRVWASADGKQLGSVAANPLGVADRLSLAEKELTAREATATQTAAAAKAAQEVARKAANDLAAAQKAVADTAAALQQAQAAVPAAKAALDQATVALTTAQNLVKAKDAIAKTTGAEATKAVEAAGKAKDNKDLASAAQKAQAAAVHAQTNLTAAQKEVVEKNSAQKKAAEQFAAAQKAVPEKTAAAANAPKEVQALLPVVKVSADKAAAEKKTADSAAAELTAARVRVEKLRSFLPVVKQAAK